MHWDGVFTGPLKMQKIPANQRQPSVISEQHFSDSEAIVGGSKATNPLDDQMQHPVRGKSYWIRGNL